MFGIGRIKEKMGDIYKYHALVEKRIGRIEKNIDAVDPAFLTRIIKENIDLHTRVEKLEGKVKQLELDCKFPPVA